MPRRSRPDPAPAIASSSASCASRTRCDEWATADATRAS